MNQKNCSSAPADAPPSTLRWAVLLGLKPIGCFTKPVLQAALLLAPMFAVHAADAPTLPDKPNILVILADDLGYGDVQCYNPERGKIPTPQLDRLASQGMRFTDAHSSSAKNQASLPGPALPDWQLEPILPKLADRACTFLTESAARPEPFLLYFPLTTPHTPLAVNARWQGRSGLENACADLIMETDAVVGRLVDVIENTGQADRTLVLFTSDNGFAAYAGAKELESRGHFPSGPLRGYKTEVYEGGHRGPFIIRWPGVVKAGSVCGQLVHQADLLATFADLLGAKLPDNAGEDSFSLLPLLRGGDRPVREHAVSCGANGVPGLRQGSWKLILAPDVKARTEDQLYDLAADRGETNNLVATQPARVTAMRALMERLITDGRSTPGIPQRNDVEVRRFPMESLKPQTHGDPVKFRSSDSPRLSRIPASARRGSGRDGELLVAVGGERNPDGLRRASLGPNPQNKP